MKKVLVALNERGRLCDIVAFGNEFPVSKEFLWVDAADDVAHETHAYLNGAVVVIPPRPLTEVKAAKLAQLEQAREAAERANVTVAGGVYSASEAFQAKVSRAINQTGRGKPVAGANDAWRTTDMQPVVMTAALLGQIEDALTAQSAVAWERFWQRFDAVQVATTNAAVEAVVW